MSEARVDRTGKTIIALVVSIIGGSTPEAYFGVKRAREDQT